MSLKPQPIPPVPEETVLVAQAAFPKGNLYLRLRDELGVFYQDCDFENLYSVYGQPGYAPAALSNGVGDAIFGKSYKSFKKKDYCVAEESNVVIQLMYWQKFEN